MDIDLLLQKDDADFSQAILNYYHKTLLTNEDVRDFLQRKQLLNEDVIKHFHLGFADRTLGKHLPIKQLKAGKLVRNRLTDLNLYRDNGREHFRGCMTVPVQNLEGKIVEVIGYKINEYRLRKGTVLTEYLHSEPKGVFNLEVLPNSSEIILCQSVIDALTFWQLNYRHVTCTYIDGIIHEDLLETLKLYKTKRVILAYPRSNQDNHIASISKTLSSIGVDCFQVIFPQQMTANKYVVNAANPQEQLATLIRHAQWIEDGKVSLIKPEEKEALSVEVIDDESEDELESELASLLDSELDDDIDSEEIDVHQSIVQEDMEDEIDNEKKEGKEEISIPVSTASPSPEIPEELQPEVLEHEIRIPIGDRKYRVRGLSLNAAFAAMKVNLLVRKDRDDLFYVDKLDLYSSKQRATFVNNAAEEFGVKEDVIKRDLGRVLITLEQLQEEYRNKLLNIDPVKELSSEEYTDAMNLLKDPNLLNRVLADFELAGIVGEETNKLCGYLCATSRLLQKPISVIVQSTSAAGKSSLVDAILDFIPEESREHYSTITMQSIYYMGENALQHKILAIEESEGASNAYALKLLQSQGSISIASTGKDANNGNLVTKSYVVSGPTALFLSTTKIDVDEELVNRAILLTVNESREQTQRIHHLQKKKRTLEGLKSGIARENAIRLHRNAQRLLKPLHVINPFANELAFTDHKVRSRRDFEKYLSLVDVVAFLFQYQKKIKKIDTQDGVLEYIEVEPRDIDIANGIAVDVLGKTMSEIPPITKKLLDLICELVEGECKRQGIDKRMFHFTRKMIRDYCQWSNTSLKVHLKRLEELEYLLIVKGSHGRRIEYELLYDSNEGKKNDKYLHGIISTQKPAYDANRSGENSKRSGRGLVEVNQKSVQENDQSNNKNKQLTKTGQKIQNNTVPHTENSLHSDMPVITQGS